MPTTFDFITGKAAFQNNMMMEADGLLSCCWVGVLVFRHGYGFRWWKALGFALCPQASQEIVYIPVGLFFGLRVKFV